MELIQKSGKLEKSIMPSAKLKKILDLYKVDYHDLDLTSLEQLRKDYSKSAFKDLIVSEIKSLSPLQKGELMEIEIDRDKYESIKEQNTRIEEKAIEHEIEQKNQALKEIIKDSEKTPIIAEKRAILSEIEAYSKYCERFTISTLIAISLKKSVINVSSKGQSKSRSTKELLNLMEIPYISLHGHYSPKFFFNLLKLYSNSNNVLLIDESASLLANKEVLNMLLSALQKEDIYWQDDKIEMFQAPIIFNSNWLSKTPIMEAVKDRVVFNEIRLETEQIKEKILSKQSYKPNMKVWGDIKHNIFRNDKLTDFKEKIYEIIKHSNPKSVRDDEKLILIGKVSMRLVGDLSLLNYFVKIDKISEILNKDLEKKDKVELISKELVKNKKCKSKQSAKRKAYRMLKDSA